MKKIHLVVAAITLSIAGSFLALAQQPAQAPPQPMSFFIASAGSGHGANLGGMAGADKICQTLATAAGSTKTFHAYLRTQCPRPHRRWPLVQRQGRKDRQQPRRFAW